MVAPAVALALTGVFLLTGAGGALAARRGAADCGGPRAVELLHPLMSVAMIAMAWGWTGGADTANGAVQVVVFGAVAAVLAALALRRGSRDVRRARLSHGLMAGAMVWMVTAMPLLMSAGTAPVALAAGSVPAPGHGAHAGHAVAMADMPGMGGAAPAPVGAGATGVTWAPAASLALVVLLVVVGVAWGVRAVQLGSPAHRARSGERPGTLAACCHGLMSLGTAGMLAAML